MTKQRPQTAIYEKPVDEEAGELMTVAEYLGCVLMGGFIDYDGFGYAVKDGKVARTNLWGDNQKDAIDPIKPSKGVTCIPEDATHIIWFNR